MFLTFHRPCFVYTVRNKIYYNCILALYWGSNLKGATIPLKGSILVPHKYAYFKDRKVMKVHLLGYLMKNKHGTKMYYYYYHGKFVVTAVLLQIPW